MRHHRVACWIVALIACASLLDAAADPAAIHLLAGVGASYLCFAWYRADSDALGFRRTRWLGLAMVAFTAAALPYYLVRSRTDGARGTALAGYAGCLALAMLGAWAGAVVQHLIFR